MADVQPCFVWIFVYFSSSKCLFAGLTAIGTLKPAGGSVWRKCNRVSFGPLFTFLAAHACSPDLQRLGRLNRRGGVCGGRATVFRLDLCLLF